MIVTVTLNPSVDEEYLLDEIVLGSWSRANATLRMPGGRGVNVALMLTQLGYSAVAMGFLAGFNGEYIRDALRRANVTTNFVHIQGETRTNVYLSLKNPDEGTSIYEKGPRVDDEARKRFLMNYKRMINRASAVVIGGSLPAGMPKETYKELSLVAKEAGLPVYIDAYGSPFLMALETQPRMAKVPDTQIEHLAGRPVDSLEAYVAAAHKVHEMGIPWGVVSYQVYGDVFATSHGTYLAKMTRDKSQAFLFTARDALVTGMVIADAEGMGTEDSIRFAMACAIESSTHVDKNIKGRASIEPYIDKVTLEKLD